MQVPEACNRFDCGRIHRHCENCDGIVPVEQCGPERNDVDVLPEHGRVIDHEIYCDPCAAEAA